MIKERILILEAHADDLAWTMSGTVAKLIKEGCIVDSLLFTDSNFDDLGKVRMAEQKEMMKILAMSTLYPVGYEKGLRDGYLNLAVYGLMIQSLVDILARAQEENQPYTRLMTFGQDGYTGHPDHVVVANVAQRVFNMPNSLKELWSVGMSPTERELWPKDYFVNIPEVDVTNYTPIDISGTFPLKLKSIEAHKSQLSNGGEFHLRRINKIPKVEYFNIYKRQNKLRF